MVQANQGDDTSGDVSAPDAVGRGVFGHDPTGQAVLFVLAGHSLGSTPVGGEGTPQWLDLRRLLNLDAVGEPVNAKVPVEATFDGEPLLQALWPESFCDQVVDRLRELLDSQQMIPEGSPAPDRTVGETPTVAAAAPPRSEVGPVSAAESADAPLWAALDERPLPGDGPPLPGVESGEKRGELTLEDVVYHGGYPGQTKRRKKCVAVLDAAGVAVSGPNGPEFRLPWESVRSVETQNSDEAKFRLGVKARRNSTVVVFDCDQGVSIVLEANDVPTMPLKGALHEMLDGGPVRVA